MRRESQEHTQHVTLNQGKSLPLTARFILAHRDGQHTDLGIAVDAAMIHIVNMKHELKCAHEPVPSIKNWRRRIQPQMRYFMLHNAVAIA